MLCLKTTYERVCVIWDLKNGIFYITLTISQFLQINAMNDNILIAVVLRMIACLFCSHISIKINFEEKKSWWFCNSLLYFSRYVYHFFNISDFGHFCGLYLLYPYSCKWKLNLWIKLHTSFFIVVGCSICLCAYICVLFSPYLKLIYFSMIS